MCKVLKLSRCMIYYKYKETKIDTELENKVITIFHKNRKNYGTRKIKKLLKKQVSRKIISRIIKKYNFV